ncbi:MAG: glycosyltransferase [Planctomycetes bacterium GWF2_41_51]|nr:MAG: glycosyltransferase [Planctomycetes bacterium GWF2_41_51]HBG27072.1 glycosyltransferase [Phycisphaerales bacterium]
MNKNLNIVFVGLSITSSWGNGHATTYRALIRQLAARGHDVTFFECDVPWYSSNRDLPSPTFCRTLLYKDVEDLRINYERVIKNANFIILGSYVQKGVPTANWLLKTANCPVGFYDIDTPVTLAKLANGDYEYIDNSVLPRFSVYLSFTGGKTLDILQNELGSPKAIPFYCSVDIDKYFPQQQEKCYDLGYLGTFSPDRQPALKKLMLDAADKWINGKFIVVGPQYPKNVKWPKNLTKIEHLEPSKHRSFYNSQRYTLNITRIDMIKAGFSPSVRLFEAAACGTPIISDYWQGIETFFKPDDEILISSSPQQTLNYIQDIPEETRKQISINARKRVINEHTASVRAKQLEQIICSLLP